jgi:uncharacterized membrane protein
MQRKSRPDRTEQPAPSGSLGMSVGRLEAFSDGVLAIVITLLILDITVPAGATGHLGGQLMRMWPHYTAYLLSFLVVGTVWLNHHAVVRLLARTNHTVQALNLLLLLAVSVLPWPTAVLSDYLREGTPGDQRVTVALYGGSLSLMTLTFYAFWRYVLRHHELHRPDVNRKALVVRRRRYHVGLAAYPLATALGLLSAPLFIALDLALAVVYLLPTPDVRSGGSRQDHHGEGAGADTVGGRLMPSHRIGAAVPTQRGRARTRRGPRSRAS